MRWLHSISHHWFHSSQAQRSTEEGVSDQFSSQRSSWRICWALVPLYVTPSWSLGVKKSNLGIILNWTFWVRMVSPTKVAKVFFWGKYCFSPPPCSVHLSSEALGHGVPLSFQSASGVAWLFSSLCPLWQLFVNSTTESYFFQNHKLIWFLYLSIPHDYLCRVYSE